MKIDINFDKYHYIFTSNLNPIEESAIRNRYKLIHM